VNRTVHQRGWLALLLAGAVMVALPAAAAADETPIDPALPTPTVPVGSNCGSDSGPAWATVSSPPPAGMTVSIGVPRPTVNGVTYQGVVHAWDVDGSQAADGSVTGLPVLAQYASKEFAQVCEDLGVVRSRGAVGTSADNAAAESLNASLKRETLQGKKRWTGAREARLAVFRWATRYNTRRRHSRLGQISPIAFEQRSTTLASAA
jgi:hypothetical protein